MIDNTIKKLPQCAKCKVEWRKDTPLMYFHDVRVCGECALKLQNIANNWIQEVDLNATQ